MAKPVLPEPIRFFTQRLGDGSFVANVVVTFGGTGWGATERAAMQSAASGILDGLPELFAAAMKRPGHLARYGHKRSRVTRKPRRRTTRARRGAKRHK
jgi:hypothetical protein